MLSNNCSIHYPHGNGLQRLPSELLEAHITELSARITASACQWLLLLGEFDRRNLHEQWECHSPAHWLNWKCGISLGPAREHVRVARALGELPLITDAFAAGRISYSKVRAITRVATPTNEKVLAGYALAGTASHLERIVRAYRQRENEALANEESQQLNRYVHHRTLADGSLEVTMRLPAESGALLLQAVREATDVPAGTSNDTPSQRSADAIERICDAYFAQPQAARIDRTTLIVHGHPDGAQLHDGPSISNAAAQRLSCDCTLVDADTGASTRVVPAAMRRALNIRDEHRCRFPACTHTRWLDAHHRQWWTNGGTTRLDNLLLLCRHHHRAVHERGWSIDNDGTFYDPFGRPATVETRAAEPLHPQSHIDARTPIPSWAGERLDLRFVVPVP